MKKQAKELNKFLVDQFLTAEETIQKEAAKVAKSKKIKVKPLDFVFSIGPEKLN